MPIAPRTIISVIGFAALILIFVGVGLFFARDDLSRMAGNTAAAIEAEALCDPSNSIQAPDYGQVTISGGMANIDIIDRNHNPERLALEYRFVKHGRDIEAVPFTDAGATRRISIPSDGDGPIIVETVFTAGRSCSWVNRTMINDVSS